MHEICLDNENGRSYDIINAYVGNTHVKPLCRLLQTGKYKSALSVSEPKEGGRKILKKQKSKSFSLNYIDHCRFLDLYSVDENQEKAELKISKHALLEVIF